VLTDNGRTDGRPKNIMPPPPTVRVARLWRYRGKLRLKGSCLLPPKGSDGDSEGHKKVTVIRDHDTSYNYIPLFPIIRSRFTVHILTELTRDARNTPCARHIPRRLNITNTAVGEGAEKAEHEKKLGWT